MGQQVDLRGQQPPIRDQGRRGTCVSFAATASHEQLRDQGETLCVEFLHWAAKGRDGLPPTEEGTTLAAAGAALADVGQALEGLWPYDEHRDQWASVYQPPADALKEALARRRASGRSIPPTAATLRAALDAGRAPLLGVRLYEPWYRPDSTGLIAMPSPAAFALGGHAILVVGYREGEGEGGGQFVVRNSWGDDWADGGYGYLPYRYVDLHGITAWDLGV